MKKFFLIASMALFTACTSKKTDEKAATTSGTEASTQMKDINSPYPVTYSSKFVMDDPKNAETLLNLWKIWDEGDLSKAKDMFADTVEMHFSDGTILKGPRDSILAGGQRERSGMESSKGSVDAIMAVKSTDKNGHWATIWGMDRSTRKGKTDSSYVQETWRFDSTGRANFMLQYRQAATPPKK